MSRRVVMVSRGVMCDIEQSAPRGSPLAPELLAPEYHGGGGGVLWYLGFGI